MRLWIKKSAILLITISILLAIISRLSLSEIIKQIKSMNLIWFGLSLFLFIPLFMIIAKRWAIIIDEHYPICFLESLRLALVSMSLNAIVPSKLGDVSKAIFLKNKLSLQIGIGAVIFEKFLDVLALFIFSFLGTILIWQSFEFPRTIVVIYLFAISAGLLLLLISIKTNFCFNKLGILIKKIGFNCDLHELRIFLSSMISLRKKKFINVLGLSIFLWFIQLLQIYLFFASFNYFLNLFLLFGLIPIALSIGMLPVTISGIGTRDSALIFLFSNQVPISVMFGIGILCSIRAFFPALIGVILLSRTLRKTS